MYILVWVPHKQIWVHIVGLGLIIGNIGREGGSAGGKKKANGKWGDEWFPCG